VICRLRDRNAELVAVNRRLLSDYTQANAAVYAGIISRIADIDDVNIDAAVASGAPKTPTPTTISNTTKR
jgi:hypothetical protein